MKRSPLRRRSKKTAALYKEEYLPLRAKFLSAHPVCMRCGKAPSQDIHHMRGRGKYMLDVTTWAAVCRWDHGWIETHPAQAEQEGWKISRKVKFSD